MGRGREEETGRVTVTYIQARHSLEGEKCRRSAHYFIFDSKKVLTKDEHDQVNAVKPFYDTAYLRVVLDCLLVSGKVVKPDKAKYAKEAGFEDEYLEALYFSGMFAVEKSRQLLATWIVCAYLLWRAKYKPHQLILVQSKREDDAAILVYNKEPTVARISFMESNLPQHLKTVQFPKGGAYGHLFFPNGSHIWAIPEGGDIIRSNTPSVIFGDESAFQPEFDHALTAALPAIKGGGQGVFISSAEPGSFQVFVEAA